LIDLPILFFMTRNVLFYKGMLKQMNHTKKLSLLKHVIQIDVKNDII